MLDDLAKGAVEGLITAILSRKSSNQNDQNQTHTQIETQSLVLRDAQGRGRAVLTMLDAGPALTLLTEDEEVKAVVGLNEGDAYLQFWGASAGCSLIARMEGDQADVSFYDDGQVQRATLGLDSDGPTLQMRDAEGRCRVQLDVDEDGPSLVVYDEQQQEQAAVRCPD